MVKSIRYIFLVLIAAINFLYAAPEEIWILHINDIHGALAPSDAFWMNPDFPPPIGNAPAAITVINEIRETAAKKNIPVLIFDTGDWFSGAPLGDFTYGKSVIEFLNYINIDASVIGNHDFEFGLDTLQSLIRMLNAPVFCANLVKTDTDSVPDFLIPHMILEVEGVKLGLFGIITHYLTGMVSPEHMAGLSVQKHYIGAAKSVRELREQSADIIIGLTHSGFSHDQRLADSVPGIDVIIGGHSHTGVQPPKEMPRYHTIINQAYSRLTAIGVLKLQIDPQTKKIAGYDSELINLFGEEQILDKQYLSILHEWQEAVETGFDNVLGVSKRELTRSGFEESPVGNFITDAMREYAQADIAVTNSGGIRANIPAGNVTYRDLYKVEAFGNTIVMMTMTGAQIWQMLEVSVIGYHAIFQVSGLKMVYDRKAPPNQRLISVEIDGKPLDMEKEYKIVTNNFLAAGGGAYGIFRDGKNVEDTYTLIRDVMAQHLKKHSPIDYKIEGRIIAKKQ
ncbi:MAG: bifunctional metallophosphatase/5'-nucleotidase [Candidatus Latescibacteria bacterium]|nr:bifunctional metallophosphatase/5'-nucleotidase [Candidatus Latescibacterota bacterium]